MSKVGLEVCSVCVSKVGFTCLELSLVGEMGGVVWKLVNFWPILKSCLETKNVLYFSMSCFTLSKSHVLNHTLSASNRGRRNMSRWTESRILFISDTTLWTPNLYRKWTYLPHFSYSSYQPRIVFFTHAIHLTSTTFQQHFNHITFFRIHNQYVVKMLTEIYLTPRY